MRKPIGRVIGMWHWLKENLLILRQARVLAELRAMKERCIFCIIARGDIMIDTRRWERAGHRERVDR